MQLCLQEVNDQPSADVKDDPPVGLSEPANDQVGSDDQTTTTNDIPVGYCHECSKPILLTDGRKIDQPIVCIRCKRQTWIDAQPKERAS